MDQNLSKVDEDYATDMVIRFEHYILEFDQDGINYSDWTERFKNNVYDALTELYQIKEKEQSSPMVEDTNLIISWDELLDRTYEMELYIHKNKDVELIRDDASWLYTNYMITLIMGTNGTPIFDYKTHEFNEAAKNSFSDFINKHPDSATTWALTEYFAYLDSIGLQWTIMIKFRANYSSIPATGLYRNREREFFSKWKKLSGLTIWFININGKNSSIRYMQ